MSLLAHAADAIAAATLPLSDTSSVPYRGGESHFERTVAKGSIGDPAVRDALREIAAGLKPGDRMVGVALGDAPGYALATQPLPGGGMGWCVIDLHCGSSMRAEGQVEYRIPDLDDALALVPLA
jgi:hypothetical protein